MHGTIAIANIGNSRKLYGNSESQNSLRPKLDSLKQIEALKWTMWLTIAALSLAAFRAATIVSLGKG